MPIPKELDQPVLGDPRTIRQRVEDIGNVDKDKKPVFLEGFKGLILEKFKDFGYTDPIFHLSTAEEVDRALKILKQDLIPEDPSKARFTYTPAEVLLFLDKFSLEGNKPSTQKVLAELLQTSTATVSLHQRRAVDSLWRLLPTRLLIPEVVEFETKRGRPNLERIDSPKFDDSREPEVRSLAFGYVESISSIPDFQEYCAAAFWFGPKESYEFSQSEYKYKLKNGNQFPDPKSMDAFDQFTGRMRNPISPHFTLTRRRLDWQEGAPDTGEKVVFGIGDLIYSYDDDDIEVMMRLSNTYFSLEKAQQILVDLKAGR